MERCLRGRRKAYTYADNVPFLARNSGTFGVHIGYGIFDGGKKRAALRERSTQVAQAKEDLGRIRDEVRVETAYNNLEQTQQMGKTQINDNLRAPSKGATRLIPAKSMAIRTEGFPGSTSRVASVEAGSIA